jgi:hypothetical protein
MAVFPDRLIMRLTEGDLAIVRLDGSVQYSKPSMRRDLNIDSSGKLWGVCVIDHESGCWIDPYQLGQLHIVELGPGYQAAALDANGRMWAAVDEHAELIENGLPVSSLRRKPSRDSTRPSPLLPGRNGQLWFIGEDIRGLSPRIEFHDRAEMGRYSPLCGFEDPRGHLWVALSGLGLVEWIPDSRWQRWFSEDLANEPTVLVVRDRRGSTILATHKNLYRLNPQAGKWTPLTHEPRRYDGLLPLEDGGFLAAIRNFGVARLSPEGKLMERLKDLLPQPDEYRKILRDGKGRVWVCTKRVLLRVEGDTGALHFREESLPGVQSGRGQDPVDLELDDIGNPWVGYAQGIAWLDAQDHWHKLDTDQPVTLVRSLTLAGKDDIWVAHRRSGAFSRLHRTGEKWIVSLYSTEKGYNPPNTDFLKVDSRGWIWRGTSGGVFVSDGSHFAPQDWIHLDSANGLASDDNNQYGFFEDTDGSVWIAGEQGVSHVQPDASWFRAPGNAAAPQVSKVDVDGQISLLRAAMPSALPADTKVLRIDVGSLLASPFRDYPLRYRLLPDVKEWQFSRDGSFEFRNLPAKPYTLEIAYAGEGKTPVGTYVFRIGPPLGSFGGLGVTWLWVIGCLIAMGALIPILRYVPLLEGPRFRIQKAVFVLRRRFSSRTFSSPAGAALPQDYLGETLAERYHLTRVVSRGGFSVVYEAQDLRENKARRAVKILNRTTGEGGWIRDRFAHEVAALRSVHHPGVVPILDSWISKAGEPCLAMPFLEGETLRAVLQESPLDATRVARIVRQLGAALAEVHAHGIVHRDLKPENLILTEPGTDREQIVIIDFGTAGLRVAENELAATTLMAGSFHYMAPERLTGHYSPASDVFSLGVIILEMLTGKRLADLKAMFSDAAFAQELQKALSAKLESDQAAILAGRLLPAYNPEPKLRPGSVYLWTEELASALGGGITH